MAIRNVPPAVEITHGLVRLWCSYYNGVGTPLYLDIDDIPVPGDAALDPAIARISTSTFKETVKLASRYVRWAIGWPDKKSFQVSFTPIAPDAYPLPGTFDGGSHFGAVAIALAQAVATTDRRCVRAGAQGLLHILRLVRLDRVAVCAAFDDNAGNFKPVGCIANKLESFCLPEVPRPAVAVVEVDQDLNDRDGPDVPQQEDPNYFHPLNGHGVLPILRARDPVEAYLRLWNEQAKAVGERL